MRNVLFVTSHMGAYALWLLLWQNLSLVAVQKCAKMNVLNTRGMLILNGGLFSAWKKGIL